MRWCAERPEKDSRETIEGSEAEFDEMSQDPGTDRVLEALQKLLGEAGGFVEAEAGFRNLTAPIAAVRGVVGQASLRVAWRARRRMCSTAVAVRGRWWRLGLRRLGTERTNWRTGTWGKTWSTMWAAVSAMWRAEHEGQDPRRRQENPTKNS